MTEDEAKDKWCPFVRVGLLASGEAQRGTLHGYNRMHFDNSRTPSDGSEHECRCIGSACMAWRWSGYRAGSGAWVRKAAAGEKWAPEKADGYCGLAGAVQ